MQKRFPFFTAVLVACLFISVPALADRTDIEKANALSLQADELYEKGLYKKAIPLAEQALAIREEVLGPTHPDTIKSLIFLAALYRDIGDHARTESTLKRIQAIPDNASAPENPEKTDSLDNLASLSMSLGEYERAVTLFKRILVIRQKTMGPRHPDTIATMEKLAEAYRKKGDHDKAALLLEKVQAIKAAPQE